MKKLIFLAFFSLYFCSLSFGQEFSFDELLNARKASYPAFESLVHSKGYILSHLESNERCTVFTNGDNVISYYTYYDGYNLKFKDRVAIKFETRSLDFYEHLKKQTEGGAKYSRTKLRRYTNKEYLEHLYRTEDASVHLFDITYKNDRKPYYMIEIYSIYQDK